MIAEQLARHLRHNRQVRIAIGRTIVPEGWIPHPTTARKIGATPCHQSYARTLRAWRQALRVGCLARFTPNC